MEIDAVARQPLSSLYELSLTCFIFVLFCLKYACYRFLFVAEREEE